MPPSPAADPAGTLRTRPSSSRSTFSAETAGWTRRTRRQRKQRRLPAPSPRRRISTRRDPAAIGAAAPAPACEPILVCVRAPPLGCAPTPQPLRGRAHRRGSCSKSASAWFGVVDSARGSRQTERQGGDSGGIGGLREGAGSWGAGRKTTRPPVPLEKCKRFPTTARFERARAERNAYQPWRGQVHL